MSWGGGCGGGAVGPTKTVHGSEPPDWHAAQSGSRKGGHTIKEPPLEPALHTSVVFATCKLKFRSSSAGLRSCDLGCFVSSSISCFS